MSKICASYNNISSLRYNILFFKNLYQWQHGQDGRVTSILCHFGRCWHHPFSVVQPRHTAHKCLSG